MEAGLVWGKKELYFDATKVEANASLDSTRSRSLMEHGLEEHLAGIFSEQEVLLPVEEDTNAPEIPAVGPAGREGRAALWEANAKRHRWIEKAGRQQSGRWFGGATQASGGS